MNEETIRSKSTPATSQCVLPADALDQRLVPTSYNTQVTAASTRDSPPTGPESKPVAATGAESALPNRRRTGKPPKLAFWNGAPLSARNIGMAFEFRHVPDKQMLRVRRIAVCDGAVAFLLKPGSLKRFLLQHSDRVFVVLDGRLPCHELARLMAGCKDDSIKQTFDRVCKVMDLSSYIAAIPHIRNAPSFWIKESDGNYPPVINLARLIKLIITVYPAGDSGCAMLEDFLHATTCEGKDGCYRLVVEAGAALLAMIWALAKLKNIPEAKVQIARYRLAVFSPILRVHEDRCSRKKRADYFRFRRMRRRFWITRPGGRCRRHHACDND
jgi:hypothetical protein